MNPKLIMYLLVFLAFMSFGYFAKSAPQSDVTKVNRNLKTNFDFEDQLVQGKYQYPDEAVTTVEDEKMLKDLLEVRKDFKDRMKQEALRH